MDTIREAPFGQLLRLIYRNKVLLYPEERPGFILPPGFSNDSPPPEVAGAIPSPTRSPNDESNDVEKAEDDGAVLSRAGSRTNTAPFSQERLEVEEAAEIERTESKPIVPQRTQDGLILVDWYTTDDAANPQNWSSVKKTMVALQIWYGFCFNCCGQYDMFFLLIHSISLYTFVVYCGSAIYVPSEGYVYFHS